MKNCETIPERLLGSINFKEDTINVNYKELFLSSLHELCLHDLIQAFLIGFSNSVKLINHKVNNE